MLNLKIIHADLTDGGATVYALDRLPEPSPDFYRIQRRAAEELGTTLHYRQIDVRDVPQLNEIVQDISNQEGRMDGLLACAGIQQETNALDYSAKDANTMFEVNITGTFMAAQAVAKEMIRWGNGGSMAFIASMSGSVANRVSFPDLRAGEIRAVEAALSNALQSVTSANLLSVCRASSARPTMRPRRASSSWRAISRPSGASSGSA